MNFEDLQIKAQIDVKPRMNDINTLKLKMKLQELKSRAAKYKTLAPNDAALFAAIDLCIEAPNSLKGEIDKIDKAIGRIKRSMKGDPRTKQRVEYLEYEKWALKSTITDYFREAVRRKEKLFKLLDSEEKQKEEMSKCEESFDYWFDNYAWIVDPRNPVLFAFPFQRYEFQKEATEWIFDLIFVLRSNGLIDKSRDMGVTWLVVCIFIYCWLFPRGGSQFHALITSYREDEVDQKGVPGTIFEKLRSQLRLLPSWMLPEGFKGTGKGRDEAHVSHMRIVNPQNGSTIVGTTANAETGRSGRYTIVFFDESASIKDDESSAAAASQSTKTCLFVSTPKGKLNFFAKKRFSGDIPVLSFHWTKHPYKDERWYRGQKLNMSAEMIAQELDIDYDASQPGKVYPAYDERYHVITKSDFMREVEGATAVEMDGSRRFRIPLEWHLSRAHDWGSSDSNGEHANITMWFATAKQGTKTKTHSLDISGSVFIYRMHTAPPHSTVRAVARSVHILQAPDKEQYRMVQELMSHEALSERDTYSQEHDLQYVQWNTDYNSGIAQVRDYLEVQYTHQPHPFRPKSKETPLLKGRPMIYLIVDDDQGECYFDWMTNKYQVRPGKDDKGLARLRAEFGVYHYPKSEAGKAVKKQRPEKIFDDCMDCLRCMAVTFPPVADYTIGERLELDLPTNLRNEAGRKEQDPNEKARIWLARQSYIHENKLLQKHKQHAKSRRDELYARAKERAGRR